MRSVLLVISFFYFGLGMAYSQKSKLRAAANYYKEPYEEYDKAKAAIDEATENDQSKGLAETWYYRGLIYSSLFSSEKYKSLCDHCLETAFDAFKKAVEIDPKYEKADEIKTFRIPQLVNFVFGEGVKNFNAKKYPEALGAFEQVLKMSPGDTSVILNSAYSAERSGNVQKAKYYYNQLIGMNYREVNVFLSLSGIYKQEKDSANALSILRKGRTAFPDTLSLMLAEINLLLAGNNQREATSALENVIRKDPNNQHLYLALGSTYDNLANPKDAEGNDLPKPPGYNEYVSKAEETYKKGLLINPDNYEINFNLGALYFNQGAELANQANSIKSNTEYEKAKSVYEKKFKDAEPYLEKALQLNPDDRNTLNSLKQLYVRTGETEKYNQAKEKLDNLK